MCLGKGHTGKEARFMIGLEPPSSTADLVYVIQNRNLIPEQLVFAWAFLCEFRFQGQMHITVP